MAFRYEFLLIKKYLNIFQDEKISQIRIRDYAEYQAAHFRAALRDETSNKKNVERARTQSSSSSSSNNKVKSNKHQRAPVQMGVFELRDNQFQLNMAEIQKLPLFMKFYSGSWWLKSIIEKYI